MSDADCTPGRETRSVAASFVANGEENTQIHTHTHTHM